MAKILCNYFGLSMAAEGKSEFVGRQAAAFLDRTEGNISGLGGETRTL